MSEEAWVRGLYPWLELVSQQNRLIVHNQERQMAKIEEIHSSLASLSDKVDLLIAKNTTAVRDEDLDQINSALAALNTKIEAALTPTPGA